MVDCSLEQRDDGRWHCTRPDCCWESMPVEAKRNCAAGDKQALCHERSTPQRDSSSRLNYPDTKATKGDPQCTCQIREATRRWVAAGSPNPDQALTSARLATCQVCEHWPKYKGLAMTIGLPTLNCPLGKWPGYAPCSPALEPIRTETLLAGAPLRTAAEVDRLATICKQCPEFGDGRITVKLKFPTFVCPRQRF